MGGGGEESSPEPIVEGEVGRLEAGVVGVDVTGGGFGALKAESFGRKRPVTGSRGGEFFLAVTADGAKEERKKLAIER